MPELPEVETIRAQLHPRLEGRSITEAGSHPSAKFSPAIDAVGCQISAVGRRGKYLILALDDGREAGCELVIHLGMTGRLSISADVDRNHPHLRAWWRLDEPDALDGHDAPDRPEVHDGPEVHDRPDAPDGYEVLTLHDIRRFGRVHVVDAGCYETIATLHRSVPSRSATNSPATACGRALCASRRCVKTQLLSQRPVAGVGNIYADEALWLAQINPAVRYVSRPRAARLAEAICAALLSGLRHGGTTLRDYASVDGSRGSNQHHLRCYGRAGEPCERCGVELRRKIIDARGTTWCPTCQRR